MLYINPNSLYAVIQELKDVPKQAEKGQVKLMKSMAIFLSNEVLQNTPKRTGATVSHWVASLSGPSSKQFSQGVLDTSFGRRIMGTVDKIKVGSRFNLTLNDEHARVLEEGLFEPPNPGKSRDKFVSPFTGRRFGKIWVKGGFSVQAPQGITVPAIRKTKVKFAGKFKYVKGELISATTGENLRNSLGYEDIEDE